MISQLKAFVWKISSMLQAAFLDVFGKNVDSVSSKSIDGDVTMVVDPQAATCISWIWTC